MDLFTFLLAGALIVLLWLQVRRLSARIGALETLLGAPRPARPEPQPAPTASGTAATTPRNPRPTLASSPDPISSAAVAIPDHIGEPTAKEPSAPVAPVASPPPPPGAPEASPKPRWAAPDPDAPASPKAPPRPAPKPINWERTLGVHLPVWGGAIMLLIAGYFLVSWAIEVGLASIFTPVVRVALCAIVAGLLIAAAFVVKARGIANGERIAGALAAAGIALAYGTVFLAASVFELVSGFTALLGAAAITAFAMAVATQFGQRIMLVGLLGGYLSPFFVWFSGSSNALIPYYIVILLTVSLFAIRWNGWWSALIPAIAAPTLWAVALVPTTSPVTLAIFDLLLGAIPVAVALLPLRADAERMAERRDLVLYGALLASGTIVLGALAHDFPLPLLIAEVLLSLGGLALIFVDRSVFRWAWRATLASALLVLISWWGTNPQLLLALALLLAAIHLAAPVLQLSAGLVPVRRSFEIAGLSALFFVILLVKLDGWFGAADAPWVWAAVALAIAAGFGALAFASRNSEQPLVGFAAGASAFLSLGLGLVLDPGLYALVAAFQAFGLALLYMRYRQPMLLTMHVIYACLYAVLLPVGQAVFNSEELLGMPMWRGGLADFVPSTAVQNEPITLLLIPGLLAIGAATALARVAYASMARILDVAAIVLLAAAIHFLILPDAFAGLGEQALVIGSLWFNAEALLALVAIAGGLRWGRDALIKAGEGLGVIVAAAILVAVIIPVFRFWPTIQTPGWPIFNAALTGLGLPAALLLGIAWTSRRAGLIEMARGFAAFGGLAGLITILLLIRQAIHGPTLNGSGIVPGQVELYLYSGGMLLYGFALLVAGTAFSSVALRGGSLVVVLATIGKVFLYDVSGLEGLWRAGSFLLMGIALLAVSWFYGRYVFRMNKGDRDASAATAEGVQGES
jgi:uncharacterized membrane protein